MRKISVFNFLTLNGFYKGDDNDISWHRHGGEEADFASNAANPEQPNALMFGRITYEMMAGFWPTEAGKNMNPQVAAGMNRSEKFVFSKTLKTVDWQGTTILKGDLIKETKKLKDTSGRDITILGSGSIVSQLAAHRLIDSFTFMIDPVALGSGTPLFAGVQGLIELTLVKSRSFKSGVLLLDYVAK